MTNCIFRQINQISFPLKKILFIGYDENETPVINKLIEKNYEIWHTRQSILNPIKEFDVVISFGYRHILNKNVLVKSNIPFINLHISYLPWNRGAHPNFWSFYDRTPNGVSIHLIDEGIDTGPIILQKYIQFSSEKETFAQTYKVLKSEIESLLLDNHFTILSGFFDAIPQINYGSYHSANDLPVEFSGWDSNIEAEILRLKTIRKHI